MSNLRKPPEEKSARLPNWVEGKWINLADGQAWSFPPPEAVPGYKLWASQAAREIWGRIVDLGSLDPQVIRSQVYGMMFGDGEAGLTKYRQVLALYQTGYKIIAELLKRNYDLTFADCERLLPFNYQPEDILDPKSDLRTATPEKLTIFNSALAATDINLPEEIDRVIAASGGKVSRPHDDAMRYSRQALDRIERIRTILGKVLEDTAVNSAKEDGRTLVTDKDAIKAIQIVFAGALADAAE